MRLFFFILCSLLCLFPLRGEEGDTVGKGEKKEQAEKEGKEEKKDTEDKETEKEDKNKEDKDEEKKEEKGPWFAGTILSLFPENMDPGELLAQVNFFATRQYGIYNAHSSISHKLNNHIYTALLTLEMGVTKGIDISLVTSGVYAHTSGKGHWNMGDTFVLFGFQILTDKKGTWVPDLRILLGEGFPTGKYKNLDPELNGADATGRGVYETTFSLIIRKIFYTWPCHPYNWNLNLSVAHSTKAKVKGFNVFGGSPFTNGTIGPSEEFSTNLAFEYKITKRWGCGFDLNFLYQNSASFHTNTPDIFEGAPSFYVFSVAPMLEYTFSEKSGLGGGIWFSVKGRNTPAFYSPAFYAYYTF